VAGPTGELVCAIDAPDGSSRGLALICHPHPQHGGTMDNKVVVTLARAFVQCGWRAARFNFRGVGGSGGSWDEGRGEIDDALALVGALRSPGEALALGGFSFGAYVAAQVATQHPPEQLVLVGPATQNFTVAPVPSGTLVIHGEADDVVPLAATLDWARPQAQPVVVVPGSGHFFHGQLPLLKALVVRHLS
jgi:alpha/beta superfamily hydrolase